MPYSIITRTRPVGGSLMESTLTLNSYHAELKRAERYGATVHHWQGKDHNGKPLHVAWVANGPAALDMQWWEIQHAADAAARCSTMSCKAPATHVLSWVDDFEQTVNEKVCEPYGEGYASRLSLKATLKPLEG